MNLKEIFLAITNNTQKPGGASVLRQASRRLPEKTNRDSTVLSNADQATTQPAASMSRLNAAASANKTNDNGAMASSSTSSGFGLTGVSVIHTQSVSFIFLFGLNLEILKTSLDLEISVDKILCGCLTQNICNRRIK
jgi:hypothetical protein